MPTATKKNSTTKKNGRQIGVTRLSNTGIDIMVLMQDIGGHVSIEAVTTPEDGEGLFHATVEESEWLVAKRKGELVATRHRAGADRTDMVKLMKVPLQTFA